MITRRVFCGFIAAAAIASTATASDFDGHVARFHLHWNKFLRTYLGCPKGAVTAEQCNPKIGVIDYGEFNGAAREGRSLFALTGAER